MATFTKIIFITLVLASLVAINAGSPMDVPLMRQARQYGGYGYNPYAGYGGGYGYGVPYSGYGGYGGGSSSAAAAAAASSSSNQNQGYGK